MKPIRMADPTQFLEQNFDRVGVERLTLEQIVSSPIVLKEKAKSEAEREAHLREVEKEKELVDRRLKEAGSDNPGLKYTYYQEVTRRLEERLEAYHRKGAPLEIVNSIRANLVVSPEDAYDPTSYPVYPGSKKGKYPEDDPEFYKQWVSENMVPALRRLEELIFIAEMARASKKENDNQNESANPGAQPIELTDHSKNYVMQAHHVLTSDTDFANFLNHSNNQGGAKSHSFFIECPKQVHEFSKTDIPTIPSNLPLERQSQTSHVIDWDMMRNSVLITELSNYMKKVNEENKGVRQEEDDPFKEGYYPTLFAYYNLLPKHMRENPAVVTALIGLEKKMGRIDLRERQEILNKVCKMVCPDDESELRRLEGTRGRRVAESQVVSDCAGLHSHDRPLEHRGRLHQQSKEDHVEAD